MKTTKMLTDNATNGAPPKGKKMPRRPNPETETKRPAARRKKKELSANELTLLAWQDTYAKRHRRVA